jgi:outer membrane protein assembly factor BamB
MFSTIFLICALQAQENWPQWRGPALNGISSSKDLPTTWSNTENIVWKTPLPSWSAGTPAIWGDRIFVTSPSKTENTQPAPPPEPEDEGRRRRGGDGRDPGGQKLLLLCLSKRDGTILWQQQLDEGNELFRKQNNSSPSPVTDGKHVWVVTGNGTVVALTPEGRKVWQKNLQEEYGEFGLGWGYGSSPLLYDGKLIIEVLHGRRTDDPSYLVAFEGATGKVIWRVERPTDAVDESPDAYTTPTLFQYNGQMQIVVSGGDYVTGHDPDTGRELWRTAGLNPQKDRNYRIIASPITTENMIYAPTRKKPLLALRAEDGGEVPEISLAWKWEGPAGTDVPTPICDGKYFYMVDDRGLVVCLKAGSGEVVWGPERTAQGNVSASPLLADGKIYITNEQAVTTVLAAGDKFEVKATNELDGSYTLASPAVSGSQLFVRTESHLYCIGKP